MKLHDIVNESIYSRPLVVVDVQPTYEPYFNFSVDELALFISKHSGPILMYVNADETGMTDDNVEHDIFPWWGEIFERNGLDFFSEQGIDKMSFVDKGFGYLRPLMDEGIEESSIIAVIREMYNQKVSDSRELYDGDLDLIAENFGGRVSEILTHDVISVNWLSLSQLKSHSPFYICGGAKNECLAEVLLMCNAFNIKYKIIEKFIY